MMENRGKILSSLHFSRSAQSEPIGVKIILRDRFTVFTFTRIKHAQCNLEMHVSERYIYLYALNCIDLSACRIGIQTATANRAGKIQYDRYREEKCFTN